MKKTFLFIVFFITLFLNGCEFSFGSNQNNGNQQVLDTPKVQINENGVATWKAVPNADGYLCLINGEQIETVGLFIKLDYDDNISVMAISKSDKYLNSEWSDLKTYLDLRVFYTVKYYDLDHNLIYVDKVVEKMPSTFSGVIPTVIDDDYTYTFTGWSEDLNSVTEDLEVYPVYEKELIFKGERLNTPVVVDNQNGAVSWNKVPGASQYAYIINKGEVKYTTNLFVFVNEGDTIKVKALNQDLDSLWSCEICCKIMKNTTDVRYTTKDLYENNVYELDCMPSTGTQNMLVIPVWFNDSKDYINEENKNNIILDIEKAFFGTSIETGFESVSSYYYKDSYGELVIDGFVSDWYNCGKSAKNISAYSVDNIVVDAVNWFKLTYDLDIKDFDQDQNGYLDSVCLIYGYPNYDSISSSNDNLWAYVYWLQDNKHQDLENPGPNTYFFASYDFMYDGAGDTSHCLIDTHTYIHEVGHILGLDDYYDYSGKTNPCGGFSMQDYNVGGHDPYSKMLLDWVDPYVIDESCTITIKPFESSGDLLLIAPNFSGSVYDEYLLIELYTPTGLNEFDTLYQYLDNCPQGPTQYGIRIWHVDGRLAYVSEPDYESFTESKVTTEINDLYYYPANTNTYPEKGYEDFWSQIRSFRYYNVLQLIRNDRNASYLSNEDIQNSDLFTSGDIFDINLFSKQFYNNGKFNNNSNFNYIIEFVEVTNEGALIKITKE